MDYLKDIETPSFDYAVYLKDLTSGEVLIDEGGDKIFPSASMIKVAILYAYFRLKGERDLHEKTIISESERAAWSVISDLTESAYTYLDLLTLMICYSDNTATNKIIDCLSMERINDVMKEEGLTNTKLERKMMDSQSLEKGIDNFTSANDMATLFEKIYEDHGIMLEILKKQKDNGSLKRFLDEEIVVAHKSGGLFGTNHDMGIFRLDEQPYLLGVFTKNADNNYETKDFIGKIGRKIYEGKLFHE